MSDDYDVLRDFMVDAVDDGASVEGAERAKAALLALQGRAEKAEAALHAIFDDAGSGVDLDIGYIDIGLSGQQMKTIRTALSPTQETDPRMRCPDCGKPDTINHTEFEGIGWMQRSGDPDDCGWRDCATQETDPE